MAEARENPAFSPIPATILSQEQPASCLTSLAEVLPCRTRLEYDEVLAVRPCLAFGPCGYLSWLVPEVDNMFELVVKRKIGEVVL